jgi:hypothetical protein
MCGKGVCSGGDRRHDQRLWRQYPRRFGDHVGPALGREHEVAAHVLTPLVVLPAVKQRRIVENGFRPFELLVIDKGACQCDTGVRGLGHRDRQVGAGFDRRGEGDPQPIRFAVQPRPEGVQLFECPEIILARGDAAEPCVCHSRIGVGGLPEQAPGRGGVSVENSHRLIEPAARADGLGAADHVQSTASNWLSNDADSREMYRFSARKNSTSAS